jgi:hypothetical protein
MKTVEGYRKVDGQCTRWLWRCPYCEDGRDAIGTRKIAREELRWHKAMKCKKLPAKKARR